jgi:CRISPR-associated protein Csm4
MHLCRLTILPRSPWRTPWQADTLTGLLCATAARTHGATFLHRQLIEPMLDRNPPFVLSDAFPGGYLPVPAVCRLASSTGAAVPKRARWLSESAFLAVCADPAAFQPEQARADADLFRNFDQQHNTLSRDTDASLEGGLFARPNQTLHTGERLTLYFRARDAQAADLLLELLAELALTGFGADVATGRGQFDLPDDPIPAPTLDVPPQGANGVLCLSTFQPAPADPTDGLWEAFPKHGKVGPGLGLTDVRKNTLIMFRPGACFRGDPATRFLGRALPMEAVLPPAATAELRTAEMNIIHPAFGLTIPCRMGQDAQIVLAGLRL